MINGISLDDKRWIKLLFNLDNIINMIIHCLSRWWSRRWRWWDDWWNDREKNVYNMKDLLLLLKKKTKCKLKNMIKMQWRWLEMMKMQWWRCNDDHGDGGTWFLLKSLKESYLWSLINRELGHHPNILVQYNNKR